MTPDELRTLVKQNADLLTEIVALTDERDALRAALQEIADSAESTRDRAIARAALEERP